jgi:Alginate export
MRTSDRHCFHFAVANGARLALIGAVGLRFLVMDDVAAAEAQGSDSGTEVTRPAADAQAAPLTELKRPALQVGSTARFNEDWSVLRGVDLATTGDFLDRLKFIPLTGDGSVWLSLGGQARARVEYFRHYLFGASEPKDTDAYLLTRFRLLADLHVTQYFRAFAEFKSSMELDRQLEGKATPAYVDQTDLLNAFGDLVLPLGEQVSLTFRGGRQELLFGSQRMVGPGDFSQDPKTFDGGAAYVRAGDWAITDFWGMFVPIVHKYSFNKSTIDQQLFGIFATRPIEALGRPPASGFLRPLSAQTDARNDAWPSGEIDFYWLGVANTSATFNGTHGHELRQTLGARAKGMIGQTNFDFDVEVAGQFGSVGSGSIAAGMTSAVLGYTPPVLSRLAPRLYLEFDYASGDKNPGGNVNTYNQLYPDAHSFLGYIDYIGRQNVISPSGGVIISPVRDLTVSLQQYFFWRASDRDAVYNKVGGVLRHGTGSSANYVGAELDILADYSITRHLNTYAGWSRFFPGQFIRETGPSQTSDFFYFAFQYTF